MIRGFNIEGKEVDLGSQQDNEDYNLMGEQLLSFLTLLSVSAKDIITKVIIDHEDYEVIVRQK